MYRSTTVLHVMPSLVYIQVYNMYMYGVRIDNECAAIYGYKFPEPERPPLVERSCRICEFQFSRERKKERKKKTTKWSRLYEAFIENIDSQDFPVVRVEMDVLTVYV